MSRESYYLRCEDAIEALPFLKTETDLAFRPEGVGFVGGIPDWSQKPGWDFEISPHYFDEVVWPALATRIPAMERIKLERSWRGHYARSVLDYSPILGRAGGRLDNLVLANGFSGHGIMHAPGTGRGMAELILQGGYQTLDLSCFGYDRIRENRPFRENGIV
jgi:glycine/D-amino acid oxidase-like deaminating enzyme